MQAHSFYPFAAIAKQNNFVFAVFIVRICLQHTQKPYGILLAPKYFSQPASNQLLDEKRSFRSVSCEGWWIPKAVGGPALSCCSCRVCSIWFACTSRWAVFKACVGLMIRPGFFEVIPSFVYGGLSLFMNGKLTKTNHAGVLNSTQVMLFNAFCVNEMLGNVPSGLAFCVFSVFMPGACVFTSVSATAEIWMAELLWGPHSQVSKVARGCVPRGRHYGSWD